MAVMKMNETRNASAQFITGINQDGKETHMTRTIASFKTDADLDSIVEVVAEIGSLFPHPIKGIFMTERCELVV
ncbi:DUF1659 domain-containing protein [Natronincola ferrireducens]|uniref:DUF1659 domain-containing protein n=1 Tax=Natronincola ferrireducens TaxID=393762 RepID=A0A1G9IDB9_9FIRM|nr:hypothetical protein [Natronincola ferrireducens]SDL23230.1 hypothetical protein SAMN05660472_02837 [Natronincola ferrireducens]